MKGKLGKYPRVTYYFFALFNTSLDLGDVALRLVISEAFNLTLAQNGQILLGRQLALAKALAGYAL